VLEEQTNMSSQPNPGSRGLNRNEIERKANEVVHLMLVWEQKKIPIKRQDINKLVMKDYRSLFNEVLPIADKKLQKVFGLKIEEIGEGSKKAYMLKNIIEMPQTDNPLLKVWQNDAKMGLLTCILTLIYMSGNVLSDSALWNALKRLHNIEKDKMHRKFGDVKKLITNEFVRQMYLEQTKVPNSDPPQFEYRWGQRANVETSKRKILEFVTQLYGKSDIGVWKSQFQDMLDSEQQAAQD